MPDFERKLQKFLTTQKGKVKIFRAAIDLKRTIHEARKIIPERHALKNIILPLLVDLELTPNQ
ncbi:MAG: hypothetical protein AB4426_05970 [Xenococcaceae cyanobacterium]